MRRAVARTKKTSFYFYENENTYERSNICSFGSKRDSALFPKKYRNVTESYKEEKRALGKLLPSTLQKPDPKRYRKTYCSASWESKSRFRVDFSMLVNTSNLIR